MTLQITLPFGNKQSVKNLVFTILTKEYPLKLVELYNHIKKRYGKDVTYQAVRKAVQELIEADVISNKNNLYSINIDWVIESKQQLETIHQLLAKGPKSSKEQTIDGNVTVYEFPTLHAMMQFWEELIQDWSKKIKVGDMHTNFYQTRHIWEALSHLEQERNTMTQVIDKGIKSIALITADTPLDRSIKNFYQSIGIKTYIRPTNSSFDKGYQVGTYGDLVVQTTLPKPLVDAIDAFFHKNKSIETLNLNELSKIVRSKIPVKMTVIKDAQMAKHINQSILSQVNA